MGRPRLSNLDLPERVQLRRGKYYYLTNGRWLPLGADKDAAIAKAAAFNEADAAARLEAVAAERQASAELRRMVFARDGECCVYCGASERLALDHVIPASMGGASSMRNLVVACETCNFTKSDGDLIEFIVKLQGFAAKFLSAKLAASPPAS